MSEDSLANSIYVGAPVEHDSERQFLASAVEWLKEQQIAFLILANFHLGGRQIDCVIVTANSVSVIEVKSSFLPVRGGINGRWERLDASGDWRPYTNAYQQALTAKNALRDAMTAAKPVGDFYPDGHVVFTSGLAKGSEVTAGDFKVKVATFDQFLANLKLQGTALWSFSDWGSFAAKHALTPVALEDVVASREHREALELVTQFNSSVAEEYGRESSRWLPENPAQQRDLHSAATSGTGCFITGASGCGKTLMAKWIASKLAGAGNPVFFFSAKEFAGTWGDALQREIALLTEQKLPALRRAIMRVDRPVFLILDGIN